MPGVSGLRKISIQRFLMFSPKHAAEKINSANLKPNIHFCDIVDRNVSNITLEQVGEIERKIKEAHERREEARKLQNSTDQMVAEITKITEEVVEVSFGYVGITVVREGVLGGRGLNSRCRRVCDQSSECAWVNSWISRF